MSALTEAILKHFACPNSSEHGLCFDNCCLHGNETERQEREDGH